MQSGLVELFEQLRELRRRLDLPDAIQTDESSSAIVPLFTRVSTTPKPSNEVSVSSEESQADVQTVDSSETIPKETMQPNDDSGDDAIVHSDTTDFETDEPTEPESVPSTQVSDESPVLGTASVSRLLDPIAHELKTGHANADVIAEYLKTARDDLTAKGSLDDRVARDMDVVLRFLRARGAKRIRPEERDNILKRIDRWKTYLE
ncbi:MAG: hypothetical protein JSW61_00185 [Candidatus Thorarchaeota archaeon]|nr:MAG: hypothetical protein JSW61_00185 [Candidatus Thorarchaeota archaeon]